ncbi:MAG TPA: hypothetical protein VGH62_12260 [Bradyrhizobium sp.]
MNSKGLWEPLSFSWPVSLATLFFGAAMAIPGERKIALSIPTQTAMKGLRDAAEISLCRSAMRREIFAIDFAVI